MPVRDMSNFSELPGRGSIGQTLAQARASLKEPSRPFTPAETRLSRALLNGADYRPASRPAGFEAECYDVHSARSRAGEGRGGVADGGGGASSGSRSAGDDDGVWAENRTSSSSSRRRDGPSSDRATPQPETESHDGGRARHADVEDIVDQLECELSEAGSADLETVRTLVEQLEACATPSVAYERTVSSLCRVLELSDATLVLDAARVSLHLLNARSAHQLPKQRLVVCKRMFQISRTPTHDEHFFQSRSIHNLLHLLGESARHITQRCRGDARGMAVARGLSTEALIYAAGVVKNLSNSEQHQRSLGQLGTIRVLCDVLRASGMLMDAVAADEDGGSSARRLEKHMAQLLIQLTGAMRNMCIEKAHQPQLEQSEAATALCAVLRPFASHGELMFNVARVLAKLSLFESMRASLNADPRHVQDLLHVMGTPRLDDDKPQVRRGAICPLAPPQPHV